MPILTNERWEKFCHFRCAGYTGADSARQAGYTAGKNVANTAHSLMKNPLIVDRIAEIKAAGLIMPAPHGQLLRGGKNRPGTSPLIATPLRSKPTKEQVIADLQEVADEAGVARNYLARLRALELIGKTMAMFADKTITVSSPLDGLTADQLVLLLDAVEKFDKPKVIDVTADIQPQIAPQVTHQADDGDAA